MNAAGPGWNCIIMASLDSVKNISQACPTKKSPLVFDSHGQRRG